MKRWAAVAALLLLPLTMAPKIALVPNGEMVEIQATVSRLSVRPGTPVTAVLFVTNVSGGSLEAVTLDARMLLNGTDTKEVPFMALPPQCAPLANDPSVIRCALGDFYDGQSKSLRLTARPLAPGQVSYDLEVAFGGLGMSAPRVPIDDIVITVARPRR